MSIKYLVLSEKCATPQLAPCKITESIAISVMRKVTIYANVENMDDVKLSETVRTTEST